jgi:hypothetical protein
VRGRCARGRRSICGAVTGMPGAVTVLRQSSARRCCWAGAGGYVLAHRARNAFDKLASSIAPVKTGNESTP